jgi:hypothetical protein
MSIIVSREYTRLLDLGVGQESESTSLSSLAFAIDAASESVAGSESDDDATSVELESSTAIWPSEIDLCKSGLMTTVAVGVEGVLSESVSEKSE